MTNPAHAYTNYRRAMGSLEAARVLASNAHVLIKQAAKSMDRTANENVKREFGIVLDAIKDAKYEVGLAMDELRSQRQANLE